MSMDDAAFTALKDKLETILRRWVKPIGLGWWDIEGHYHRDDYPYPGEEAGRTSLAICRPNWSYMEADILFNMPALNGKSDKDLEHIVVHELMHIFLNEMHESGVEHEERVATTLENAFLWLQRAFRDGDLT
jgi:hypothetical protein